MKNYHDLVFEPPKRKKVSMRVVQCRWFDTRLNMTSNFFSVKNINLLSYNILITKLANTFRDIS